MNKTTLSILLTAALTGCVSNGDPLVGSLNQLANDVLTPLTNSTAVNRTQTVTQSLEHTTAQTWQPSEQNCKAIEGNLGIAVRAKQQQCLTYMANKTVESSQALSATLSPRNPPQITKLGTRNPDESKSQTVENTKHTFKRTVLVDRSAPLDVVGFSMDFQPVSMPSVFKAEYRKVTSPTCSSGIGMEQAIWIDHKSGAPKASKVHCFARTGETTLINMTNDMDQALYSNATGYRMFTIKGTLIDGQPHVNVFMSEAQQIK